MKNIIISLALISGVVNAHNLFSFGANNGDKFEANIIYGHDFPDPEKIPEARLKIFEPLKIYGENYEQALKQSGENFHYEGAALKNGSYVLVANYKPTAWIQKVDGTWEMDKTRKDVKDEVKYCGISSMKGKAIIKVGSEDIKFGLNPLQNGLEITPLDQIMLDKTTKFKLTFNNEPVKNVEIFGNYAGYNEIDHDHDEGEEIFAFYTKTDNHGDFYFKPMKKGLWYLEAKHNTDSGDKNCEILNNKTTLTFMIK